MREPKDEVRVINVKIDETDKRLTTRIDALSEKVGIKRHTLKD